MNQTSRHEQKKNLTREKQVTLQQIYNLTQKVKEIDLKIEKIVSEITDCRELAVTDHAMQRFRERVCDVPTKVIRQLLTSNDLLEAFKKKGDGRYGLAGYKNIVLHIKDFAIVTVINTAEPEKKLETLRHYMNYFIEELALKHTGHNVKIMKLKTFHNLYWRNETPNQSKVA